MRIWVDADACPGDVKELLYRAADKRKVTMIFVANQPVRTPRSEYLSSICVPGGMNMADRHIVDQVEPGDLVITADIPLAAAVIDKGAEALEFRGELFTATSIGERLAARNLLDQLRGGGLITGGPAGYSSNDRQAFANQFDRWLTKKR
ncbi:MAG: YaiI/YqxD family protein [Planctomycetaceae bacterium]|nr:YaiI/YqxD family protein [Planctomycetaceae bacterium]